MNDINPNSIKNKKMRKLCTFFIILIASGKLFSQVQPCDEESGNVRALTAAITTAGYASDNLNVAALTVKADYVFTFEINLSEGVNSVFAITVDYSVTDIEYLKIKDENQSVLQSAIKKGSGDFISEWTAGYS